MIQIFHKYFKEQKKKAFSGNLYRIIERTIWFQTTLYFDLRFPYTLFIKLYFKCFLNGRCRSNHILRDSSFLKIFEIGKKYEILMKFWWNPWIEQYESNCIIQDTVFFINFLKPKDMWGLGGHLKKIIERAIWVKL